MDEARVTGGVFEVGIGVENLARAESYWRGFGYRAGPRGTLPAAQAQQLYGVDAALESVRLLHQDADHGLVRLMRWDRPMGPGIGTVALRTNGNRWAVCKTREVQAVANHARMLAAKMPGVWFTEPVSRLVGATMDEVDPFAAPFPIKSEVMLYTPELRHVMVQRYAHDLPHFGAYNDDCLFRASQFTQVGLCIDPADKPKLDFYDRVLGLRRSAEHAFVAKEGEFLARMTGLRDGERLIEIDFDDVRSDPAPDRQLSGKLRVFLIESAGLASTFDRCNPGNRGFSLYTLRSHDIAALRARVLAGGGRSVSAVQRDEFGADAFSATAPDGYAWAFVAASGSAA